VTQWGDDIHAALERGARRHYGFVSEVIPSKKTPSLGNSQKWNKCYLLKNSDPPPLLASDKMGAIHDGHKVYSQIFVRGGGSQKARTTFPEKGYQEQSSEERAGDTLFSLCSQPPVFTPTRGPDAPKSKTADAWAGWERLAHTPRRARTAAAAGCKPL